MGLIGTNLGTNQIQPVDGLTGLIWTLPKSAIHTSIDIPLNGGFDGGVRFEEYIFGAEGDAAADIAIITSVSYFPDGVRLTIDVGASVPTATYDLEISSRGKTTKTYTGIFSVVAAGGSATSNKTVILSIQEDGVLSGANISSQTTITPVSGDFVPFSDTSDGGLLKKADVVHFLGGGGGASPTLRNVSSTDTFATASETINCTSGTFTVNLPTAVGIQGTVFTLVNSGSGLITMDGNGVETINGSTTIDLTQYQSRTVQSDGVNWVII